MQYSKHSTDTELIQGCQEGHRLAQKHLYQRFYGRMVGITMRYTKNTDEANEILNTAFLKVFNAIGNYEPKGSISGWIARIVFNTAIDHVRRHTKYKKTIDYNIEKDAFLDADVISNLFMEDLYAMIQQLPKPNQSVFSLYFIEGYKHREIAEILDISINTSKWHLAKAKETLKKIVTAQSRVTISVKNTSKRERK